MEVRGRNGKWFGTGNRGAVRVVGVDVICQFSPGIPQIGGGVDAFVVIDIIKCRAKVGHHKCVGGENRGRNGRGSIDGKEGADSREVAADFFFLNVEETRDVLNHLLVGERQFIASRTVRRRGGNEVGGVASAVNRRRRVGGDKNGGR